MPFAIVLAFLNWSNATAGDWNCDEKTLNKPQVTETWFGLDLDQPFKIRVDGVPFVVPAGYFALWPDPEWDINDRDYPLDVRET